ncbi:tRNA preQ1(34) S-adenosylmethionine ribosyltransferase-isomerase QueA [bacterium]|nr:tRNA preQ1(34) S-adenosylmethionine ribosyltransferase-isomerase QueA [bacterium]
MNSSEARPAAAAYAFDLPDRLIAQVPTEDRASSRLLLVDRGRGVRGEARFRELPEILEPHDLLVVNDSRVLPARLRLRRDPEGGRVELLLVRPRGDGTWLAMARPARRLRPGSRLLTLTGDERPDTIEIVNVLDAGYVVVGAPTGTVPAVAARAGETPLPPYIRRDPQSADYAALSAMDRRRYQTVYATAEGSVAAPTAGLHFDEALLDALAARGVAMAGVTLHVGPGTFRPPAAADMRARRLHEEFFTYTAATDAAVAATRARGGRVIAVGTTALRVLETVARLRLADRADARAEWPDDATQRPVFAGTARREAAGWCVTGLTRLFVMPPDEIAVADGLITNFHLPGSSLLMLIAAYAGVDVWREVYGHAIEAGYRFYSYGDAMLVMTAGGVPGEARRDE